MTRASWPPSSWSTVQSIDLTQLSLLHTPACNERATHRELRMDVKGSKNVADGATTLTKVARASQGSVQFLDDSEWKQISLSLRLSPREAEIVRLLLSARSEKNVAEALAISVHTVHSHLERLYRKLSIRSRSELLVSIFLAYVQRQR